MLISFRSRAAAVVTAVLLSACSPRKPLTTNEEPVPVRVQPANEVERRVVIRAGGTVEARESIELGFQLAGRIQRVYVEEGQSVKAGQVLAELDPADYQFGADIASGEASAAQALAEKAKAGTRRQDLAQAQAAFDQADDEYRRMKTLFERKSLAPNDFKKIEAHYLVSRQKLDEAKEGARAEDIAAAVAKAGQAGANVKLNRKRVADTKLLSPISGVIGRRLMDPGEMVAAGMPVFAVLNLNPVRVRVGIPEAEVVRVKLGQKAVVTIPAMDGAAFEGRIELLGYAAEPSSRTFAVRILVPNPKLTLRAGMIAEAEIEGDATVRAITIPGSAIVRDPQGATLVYVYYPEKQRVFERRVAVGRAMDREVEITSGLSRNDRIVVAGQQKVREGGLVKLMEDAR